MLFQGSVTHPETEIDSKMKITKTANSEVRDGTSDTEPSEQKPRHQYFDSTRQPQQSFSHPQPSGTEYKEEVRSLFIK